MNLHPLIEAIVRQTTVLIAHLATVAGAPATLACTADQVFLNLAELSKLVPAAEPPMDRAIAHLLIGSQGAPIVTTSGMIPISTRGCDVER
jgi:hypothetical protein